MNNNRGLWRGKCKSNGEWFDGGYFKTQIAQEVVHCIVQFHLFVNTLLDDEVYQIIPETLGECTGLRDTNGILIFEGDICSVSMSNIADDEYGIVRFDENEAVFVIEFGTYTINFCDNINSSQVEIVGNIYDNPELIAAK